MTWLQAIALGIIEGLTEYLPVSSTFHLIWVAKPLGVVSSDFLKLFEVVIQSGAILAVMVLYYRDFFTNRSLLVRVLFSFIPTAIVGFLLYRTIKGVFFENMSLQLIVFVVVGLVFILFEKSKYSQKLHREINTITFAEAVLVGITQGLAIIPGVSRAGGVIVTLMILGVKRKAAAKYSFLLALPTLMAASGLDLVKSYPLILTQSQYLSLLIVGLIASFVAALVVVKWFVGYLEKHDLQVFGWYRVILGVILLLLSIPFINSQ